jgi:ribosomal protein S18 acetylase RimI-like enzyme
VASVEIKELTGEELVLAGGVVARALRDNPTNVVVFGDDRLQRAQTTYEIFIGHLPNMDTAPVGAVRGSCIVGVWAMAAPGSCARHKLPAEFLTMPTTIGSFGDLTRIQHWLATWAEHDLPQRHWHVGPVGVEPGLQGLGVGRAMMDVFCARMDAAAEIAFLETDKLENVRFYGAGGFEVVDQIDLLGAPNWFMRRDPR